MNRTWINLLVILSLLLSSAGINRPALAYTPSPSGQEATPGVTPEATLTPTPVAAPENGAYPPPEATPPPPTEPSPTPTPEETTPQSPENTPDSHNPADEAELAAYLLDQIPPDSPLLGASETRSDATQPAQTQVALRLAALQAPQPGASLTLAYQISAPLTSDPLSAENYRLQVQAPAAATWQGKDPSLFDVASLTLDLPLEYPSGLLSFYIDPQALGPFEFQASLSLAQTSLLNLANSEPAPGQPEPVLIRKRPEPDTRRRRSGLRLRRASAGAHPPCSRLPGAHPAHPHPPGRSAAAAFPQRTTLRNPGAQRRRPASADPIRRTPDHPGALRPGNAARTGRTTAPGLLRPHKPGLDQTAHPGGPAEPAAERQPATT